MKRLFYYADRYLEKSTWKDLALIKFCLFNRSFSWHMDAIQRQEERRKDCIGCFCGNLYPSYGKVFCRNYG